jgi:cohesin domain-containing protein
MKHRNRAAAPKRQSLKEQRAASLSLMLLAAVAGTHASTADATIAYGGPARLTITPGQPSVQAGTNLVADVAFSGLQDQRIGSYDLTVTWNPALLSFSSLSYGAFLDGPGNSFQGFNPSTGSLEVSEFSFGSLANQNGFGTVPLFDVTFNSIAAGTSPLAFDAVSNGGLSVGDENGGSFTNFLSFDSSVNITAVPTQMSAPEIDPASAASALTLFVGGLLVLSGRRSTSPLAMGD